MVRACFVAMERTNGQKLTALPHSAYIAAELIHDHLQACSPLISKHRFTRTFCWLLMEISLTWKHYLQLLVLAHVHSPVLLHIVIPDTSGFEKTSRGVTEVITMAFIYHNTQTKAVDGLPDIIFPVASEVWLLHCVSPRGIPPIIRVEKLSFE